MGAMMSLPTWSFDVFLAVCAGGERDGIEGRTRSPTEKKLSGLAAVKNHVKIKNREHDRAGEVGCLISMLVARACELGGAPHWLRGFAMEADTSPLPGSPLRHRQPGA